MNGYSQTVSKLTDAQLTKELNKCSTNWTNYSDPATDRFYYYKALLEEAKTRKMLK